MMLLKNIHPTHESYLRRLPEQWTSSGLRDFELRISPLLRRKLGCLSKGKRQMVKMREMVAGRWETQVLRLWTNGKRIFPFVQCLHRKLSTQCSGWTKGKIFLPFVHDMRGVWTSGKQGQPIDILGRR